MLLYTENRAGVHLMNPINSEYSLCGDAFDDYESEDGCLNKTSKRYVTCKRCRDIITHCRRVKL